jgi:hypothetical protein
MNDKYEIICRIKSQNKTSKKEINNRILIQLPDISKFSIQETKIKFASA